MAITNIDSRFAEPAADKSAMSSKRTEHLFVGLILAAFLIVQVNAVMRDAAMGQDFSVHKSNVLKAAHDPIDWVCGSHARTSPPIYHLIIAPIYHLAGPNSWLFFTGLFNSLTNLAALIIYYHICSLMIKSVSLRLTALILVTFLPVVQITSVVLAADAVSQLPVFAIVLVFALLVKDQISLIPGLIVITLAALFCVSTKYLGITLIGTVPICFFLLWYLKVITLRTFLLFSAVFSVLTATLACYWINQRTANITDNFSPQMGGMAKPPTHINARSLLFFRLGDVDLLDAPQLYDDLISQDKSVKTSLYNSNYFSYPGLVCLGTFTDCLNIFQHRGAAPFIRRAPLTQSLMALSMKIGVVSTLLGCILATGASLRSLKRVFWDRDRNYAPPLITAVVAGGWLVFMMGIMARATMAYPYGYWFPRLIVPSIMLTVMLAFNGLDAISGPMRKPVCLFVFCFAIIQSALHICALW